MKDIKWTDNQKQVIAARDKNILVAAGAGSGKTAVLVERIIRMVTDKENPIDIDKFLIVTFTRAAAAQMKEKIRNKLYEMSYKDPDDENLKRQISLIHTANISTIDSFANMIVSKYFEEIDIDPNFRVMEEEEETMIVEDALQEVLDEYYASEDEEFLSVMEMIAEGKKDANVLEMIQNIIKKANNQVFPKKWLEDGKGKNHFDSVEEFNKSDAVDYIIDYLRSYKDFEVEVRYAYTVCMEKGNESIQECLRNDAETIDKLNAANTYDEIRDIILNYKKLGIGTKYEFEEREDVKKIHNYLGSYQTSMKKIMGYFPPLEEEMEEVNKSQRVADMLIDIALKTMDNCEREKKYIRALSFNDVSHYAINILCKVDENGDIMPTKTAEDLSKEFYEILIDEYQDSNYIQEYMLKALTGGRNVGNMFMVGDVKQSIYRFRSAEPKLFLKKYNTFSENGKEDQKIMLGNNFRSRPEVIDSANYIFKQLMKKEIGGINYADNEELVQGAENYTPDVNKGENDNKTEFITVASNDKGFKTAEAELIAKRILKLMDEKDGLKITDESENKRSLKYKDIVILTRTPSTVIDEYINVLESYGIPVFGEKKKGFYSATEVNAILDIMRIVDNPIQDIPLASVLRNEIFDFSDEELAQIRIANQGKKLYLSLQDYAVNGKDFDLREKVDDFLDTLSDYRERAKYMSVYEFIEYLLQSTHFDHYVRALPIGSRKAMNIDMLKEIAYDYESTSYRGLFNFIRYIEKNIENDKDTGEAIEVGEDDDVVKIVSIHKSKGLEYPVVILANMCGQIKNYARDSFIDSNCNIGTKSYDTEKKTKSDTFIGEYIKANEQRETKAEYLRLLYVAMTRAKEKLIITSSFKGELDDKVISKFKPFDESDYESVVLNASSYFNMIAPIIADGIYEKFPESLTKEDDIFKKETDFFRVQLISNLDEYGMVKNIDEEEVKENTEVDKDVAAIIENNFKKKYLFEEEKTLRAKMSVTEIKRNLSKQFVDEDASYFYPNRSTNGKPNFIEKEESGDFTPAEKGNIYHKIFELLDYSLTITDKKEIDEFLDKLVKDGQLTKEEIDAIDKQKVMDFTNSPLAQRMKNAFDKNELYRERKFLMQVDGKETKRIQKLDFDTDETTIVQGIIDACFVEDGKYVIVDYKTDRVDSTDKLVEEYKDQLDVYEEAIKQITDMDVAEKIIYSVELGEERPL